MYLISCFKGKALIDVSHMNVSLDLDPVTIGLPRRASPPSGCGLDCKDKLLHSLADRARLRILEVLCKGAKTVEQIAAAPRGRLAAGRILNREYEHCEH